jgi:type VI secretion system secreted protein VgrG
MSQGIFQLINEHLPAAETAVASFTGKEEMSASYAFDLVVRASVAGVELSSLEDKLPGSRATLRLATGEDGARWVHGIVTSIDAVRSLEGGGVELAVRLEPRLALLGLNLDSRIFQEMTTVEVAQKVLDGWGIAHELKLKHPYRKRTYLTQYQESDYDFLRRILANEGIFFYFTHAAPEGDTPAEEKIVLCDDAALYAATDGNLRFAGEGDGIGMTQLVEQVFGFGRARRVKSLHALVGDFDFRNPGLPLRAEHEGGDPHVGDPHAPALHVRSYHHGFDAEIEGASGKAEIDRQRARAVLDGHRAESRVATGKSNARRLMVGHVFRLEGHPLEHGDGAYAVTRIEHEGRVPELVGGDAPIYDNRFECVPEAVPFRPPPLPARRRQVAETATVVGSGSDEIFTDDLGRIKVKFHWDLGPGKDETSSCWIRVSQPWASTHFGMQFIPRVGDEVLVTFVGGDPDRPIVSGSLYNGTHPTPFALPNDKTVSGLRTQSTPGGGGFNELSFDDKLGKEKVYLRAEKDLIEDVRQDHRLLVQRDDVMVVQRDQIVSVAARQEVTVGADHTLVVHGSHQLSADGNGKLAFSGDVDMTVGQQLTTTLLGREQKEVKQTSNETYFEDQVSRVLGHRTIIVGQHDARRAYNLHVEGGATQYSSGSTLITSDKDIELRVGDNAIRITEDGIELVTKKLRIDGEEVEMRLDKTLSIEAKEQITEKSKKVLLQSESAFIGLAKIAKLNGQTVKLNCTDDPIDELKEPEEKKPTKIALADEKGKPLAKQRYILVLPDGSEQTGTLDEDGKAELVIDESGDIIFPDVHDPRPA